MIRKSKEALEVVADEIIKNTHRTFNGTWNERISCYYEDIKLQCYLKKRLGKFNFDNYYF